VDRSCQESSLNADPAAQVLLLELQERDTRLVQLRHRAASLPEAVALAEAQKRHARLADETVAAETIASDLERDQKRADADVEQVRERSRRDREMLDSGSITDSKQLTSLQHELQSLARRQSELEDIELEIMERVEGARAAVVVLSQERDEVAALVADLEQQVAVLMAEVDAERVNVEADRADTAGRIPSDLLALYEKVRAENNGVGAARLYRGRCEGCHLDMPPQELESVRAAASDAIVRCEECRRILIRTFESGL
jgi:predicted  nucleic acid-binding Zn-ribbon protein